MTENMLQMLKNIDSNKGKVINNLIKSNVLTITDVVSAAIESKDSNIILSLANYIKNLSNEDIGKLADAIIVTENAWGIWSFARDVKGAPIEKLTDAVIASKKAYYIYHFACDVKGAPIGKLAEAIIATGNMEYIHLFMQNVPGIPKKYKNMAYPILERKKKIEEGNEAMAKLIELAINGDLKTIESEADTYRSLLLGTETEVQEKPMTKVRKPVKQ